MALASVLTDGTDVATPDDLWLVQDLLLKAIAREALGDCAATVADLERALSVV
jgi:hypothetical protein